MAGQLGIDIGGTNADFVLVDDSGNAHALKSPVIPENPIASVVDGIRRIASEAGLAPSDIDGIVHGVPYSACDFSTVDGRVGLLVTEGFEHVLTLARGLKHNAPTDRIVATVGVHERLDSGGRIRQPLDEARTTEAIRALASQGVSAIAVSLLHAVANPVHEQRIRGLAEDAVPDLPITLSSDVLPEAAEYERTVATVLGAICRPALSRYFDDLKSALSAFESSPEIRVARADGGAMSVNHAKDAPLEALRAGPSAGVCAAARVATAAGHRDAIAVDIGGAAATLGIILDGEPVTRRRMRLSDANISLPAVEVARAGAGGGAVVRLTDHGALRVGPASATGGPACFGGDQPTLTDANVVLGLLPVKGLDGSINLDANAAANAIGRIADTLGLPLHQTAQGVRDLAHEKLHGAMRQAAAAHGVDISGTALVTYGGAGPMHGNALGILCGDAPVIVPSHPGMMSARGYVGAAPRREFARSYRRLIDDTNATEVGDVLGDLGNVAIQWLDEEGSAVAERQINYQADLRHRGQGAGMTLDIRPDALTNFGLRDLADRFETAAEHRHGVRLTAPIEIVRLRAIAGSKPANGRFRGAPGGGDASLARIDEQRVYLDGRFLSAPVYERSRLPAGARVIGPALVQARESTTVIHPGFVGVTEQDGVIAIARDGAEGGGR
jgi:N-methylhydantoinase A